MIRRGAVSFQPLPGVTWLASGVTPSGASLLLVRQIRARHDFGKPRRVPAKNVEMIHPVGWKFEGDFFCRVDTSVRADFQGIETADRKHRILKVATSSRRERPVYAAPVPRCAQVNVHVRPAYVSSRPGQLYRALEQRRRCCRFRRSSPRLHWFDSALPVRLDTGNSLIALSA